MINAKDLTRRISLRLTPRQFYFITSNAQSLGVSPSYYIRMIIDHQISTRAYLNALEVHNENETCNK